ncbi:MAG: hypothetical protein D6706_01490 [Chloroflexi bacterium]|nr:MAG: hypothetical protein D6706_01490 [Chloroflexota bacterium]
MTTENLSRLQDLEVRLYKLTTRSHLRVGAGEGTADVATENPIIRALILEQNGAEKRVPYIPGSSMHGVVRAWVEKVLRSGQSPLSRDELETRLGEMEQSNQKNLRDMVKREVAEFLGIGVETVTEENLFEHWRVYTNPHVCDPLSDVDKCERITIQEGQPIPWKANWWQVIGRQPPCEVCRIFGYMGQRGRVKFSHAWPTTDQPPLDVITRVAINRLTGAADEGKLFDLEAIPPGVSFHFFVVMENMNGDKEKFDLGFKALSLQFAGLGAHSTVGFGMVDVGQVFRVQIDPKIFHRDVEAEFIEPMLQQGTATLADFDQDKFPRFFRALVVAHASSQSPLPDLIRFVK